MAKKLISPGVLTNEIDASFLPAALGAIGAAVVGPASKGPVLVPTVVNNTRELDDLFGGVFTSGSNRYEYFTTITAKKILKTKGPVTFVRVSAGSPSAAVNGTLTQTEVSNSLQGQSGTTFASTQDSGSILSSTDVDVVGTGAGGVAATGSFQIAGGLYHSPTNLQASMSIGNVDFIFTSASVDLATNTTNDTTIFVQSGSNVTATAINFRNTINNSGSFHNLSLSASNSSGVVSLTATVQGNMNDGVHVHRWYNGVTPSGLDNLLMVTSSGDGALFSNVSQLNGGRDADTHLKIPFKIETIAVGETLNSRTTATGGTLRTDGTLIKGDTDNVRWEIQEVDTTVGTFSLLVRQGSDSHKRPIILEKFENLSLDSTQPNYIEKVIGNQVTTLQGSGTTEPYVKVVGEYANKSRFIRVTDVNPLPNYLDENGNLTISEASASLPAVGSGSLGGGFINGSDGTKSHPINFYDTITSTNTQGLNPTAALSGKTAYEDAINLLANQDEYDINLLYMPGITSADHSAIVTNALEMCENRGDCFAVIDPVLYNSSLSAVTSEGTKFNSSYGAMYWPWIQINDDAGMYRWVPGSVGAAEVFAFNDKTKHPWFAPAGLNRGTINAVQAERKLLNSTRDTLYRNRINPIATFPGQGVTIFGQKTLQKKSSALDRVNVRRLLIAVKKFIASSSRFLVFEQNTPALRREFLAIANPYLEKVQSKSGLNAFKVVMDNTNNTPDTIDRNQLIGHIFLQPTKAAEFITIDFTIQRTGAEFSE
tara:strand:+ start:6790 stop:9090 length:2301 start_codon:yes stop_codon:yes gene_type:complete